MLVMNVRALAAIVGGMIALAVAAETPDPARVRECSLWCVDSYATALTDSIQCIDSCGRGYTNEPTAMCSKRCVIQNTTKLPAIRECIGKCGR